jgi:hypothetical protein
LPLAVAAMLEQVAGVRSPPSPVGRGVRFWVACTAQVRRSALQELPLAPRPKAAAPERRLSGSDLRAESDPRRTVPARARRPTRATSAMSHAPFDAPDNRVRHLVGRSLRGVDDEIILEAIVNDRCFAFGRTQSAIAPRKFASP